MRSAALLTLLALFAGCRPKPPPPPPPPTIADLHFPVAVYFQKGSVVLFSNAAELGRMRYSELHAVTVPPPLIDSNFAFFTLEKLESTRNFLWLMINPTGSTPVKFELARVPRSGIEAARKLMRGRLDAQTWRSDLEEKRRALAAAQTLTDMVAIVESKER